MTRQLVWDGATLAEERNGSNVVQKRFYAQGEQISGTNYYYTRDHLGSVREMTNSSRAIVARYDYDSFGRVTVIIGTTPSDFQYAGYYAHAPSGLNFTRSIPGLRGREYDANTGRFLNRDPIGEKGGINLYDYVGNNPIDKVDPMGLWGIGFGTVNGGNFNIGVGNPTLLFTPDSWGDLQQSAAATIDGMVPFYKPFALNDPCEVTAEIRAS